MIGYTVGSGLCSRTLHPTAEKYITCPVSYNTYTIHSEERVTEMLHYIPPYGSIHQYESFNRFSPKLCNGFETRYPFYSVLPCNADKQYIFIIQ